MTNLCSLHLTTGAKQQFVNLDVPKISFSFAPNVINGIYYILVYINGITKRYYGLFGNKWLTGWTKKFCLIGCYCNMKLNNIFRRAFEISTCQLLWIRIIIYDEEHNHPASFVYAIYGSSVLCIFKTAHIFSIGKRHVTTN